MCMIRRDLKLSMRQTHYLAQDLRIAPGSRNVIENRMKEKLHTMNHQLDGLFKHRMLRFVKKEKKITDNFVEHSIVYNSVDERITKVIEVRQINDEGEIFVRIGLDGGGNFLKICISLFNLSTSEPIREWWNLLCRFYHRIFGKIKCNYPDYLFQSTF